MTFLNVDNGDVQEATLPDYRPTAATYSPDADVLYTFGFAGGRVGPTDFAALDAETGEVLWAEAIDNRAALAASWLMSVAVSPDGSTAMTAGAGEARIDLTTQDVEPFRACEGDSMSIATGVAFSPDGGTAWFVCGDYGEESATLLRPFDAASLTPGEAIRIPGLVARRIAITPDGSTAMLAETVWLGPSSADLAVHVDLATGAHTEIEQRTTGTIAISPDGRRAYVGASSPLPAGVSPPRGDDGFGSLPPTDGAEPGEGLLHAIDISQADVVTSVPLLNQDANPVVSPDGARVFALGYAAANRTAWISAHDATTLATIAEETPLDGYAYGLAITPDQAPVARLTASPPHSPVTFDASASTVEFGTIAEYAWDFGDGSSLVTTTPIVEHEYAEPGQYTAAVRLTSSGGTSTEDVYTGRQLLRNGDPSAVATVAVTVPRTELPPTGFNGAWLIVVSVGMLLLGGIVVAFRTRLQP